MAWTGGILNPPLGSLCQNGRTDTNPHPQYIMNNINITIAFGGANSLTRQVPSTYTVADVIRNQAFQTALGYTSNVRALIDGAVQPGTTTLRDNDVIELETQANSKA